MRYTLAHRCCDRDAYAPTAQELTQMYETYRKLSYQRFAQLLGAHEIRRMNRMLRYSESCRMENDYAVQFNRAVFRGQKVLVLEWSRIDHIFTLLPQL